MSNEVKFNKLLKAPPEIFASRLRDKSGRKFLFYFFELNLFWTLRKNKINVFQIKLSSKKLTKELKTFLPNKQVIDNDRQLVPIQMYAPQVFQILELFFIQIFELCKKWKKKQIKSFADQKYVSICHAVWNDAGCFLDVCTSHSMIKFHIHTQFMFIETEK